MVAFGDQADAGIGSAPRSLRKSTGSATIARISTVINTVHSLSPDGGIASVVDFERSRSRTELPSGCCVRRRRYGGPIGAATAAIDQLSSGFPRTFGFGRQSDRKLTH